MFLKRKDYYCIIDTFCKIFSNFDHKSLQVLLQYKKNLNHCLLHKTSSEETWNERYCKCASKNIVNFLGVAVCCLGSYIQKLANISVFKECWRETIDMSKFYDKWFMLALPPQHAAPKGISYCHGDGLHNVTIPHKRPDSKTNCPVTRITLF